MGPRTLKVPGSIRDQLSGTFFSKGQKGTWEPAIGLCKSIFEDTTRNENEKSSFLTPFIVSNLAEVTNYTVDGFPHKGVKSDTEFNKGLT